MRVAFFDLGAWLLLPPAQQDALMPLGMEKSTRLWLCVVKEAELMGNGRPILVLFRPEYFLEHSSQIAKCPGAITDKGRSMHRCQGLRL